MARRSLAGVIFYRELRSRQVTVRRFLPHLLRTIHFDGNPAGKPLLDALEWLRQKSGHEPPMDVVNKAWKRHVALEDGSTDRTGFTFCVLDRLHTALRRRDVFVTPSWRYGDPRSGLLSGPEWEVARPIVCRSLGLTSDPQPTLVALAEELDQTYRAVAARLPQNPAVRFEKVDGKNELVLAPLDKLDDPPSLQALREAVKARMPRVDLPEIMLEIAARTGFTNAFSHLTERAARAWGGGDVASADGMRFVVPVRTVHAAPNPKYFGMGRGVTWYNLLSDRRTGLNAITVPGTLRDSLVLLAVVLEQQTELQPTRIMTDTGACSDVVFGLFRLLGYRFSPRLADIGGTRFWRVDPCAGYGELNGLARQRVSLGPIATHWDDLLRLAGSLKLGRVPASGIMRTLQIGERPTRLAQALAEFGRIDKTIHTLTYIDDESWRRSTLVQLNLGEGRHSLARGIFHGKRGELHQRYREGQEDQLSALGLVVNVIVLWSTIYMDAVVAQLRKEGFSVHDEDVARLSPFGHGHINLLGRYSFVVPESVTRGELRPLQRPSHEP